MENCLCYFCEEEIHFVPQHNNKLLFYPTVKAQWYHVATDAVACRTVATPSNFEVVTN